MNGRSPTAACHIYGIRNCDTMKKAFAWLAEHGVEHHFVDFRQTGVDLKQLVDWSRRAGWEVLLNRRGTTWRRLAEADLAEINEARALTLMTAHPTLIRRPVIDTGDSLLIGFDAQRYAAELSKARP